nr:uncharacterized protein LOC123765985 [Procambarus clarkii]
MVKSALMLVLTLLGGASAQVGYNQQPPARSYGAPDLRDVAPSLEGLEDPVAVLAANIPGGGVPGQHYPILASVPQTGFSCQSQEFPGYFADTADEARCQVFHICQFDGRLDSFLCPNGTVFNQQYFVCDWWFNVDCAASEQFFALNSEIGKIPEDADASIRSDAGTPNQLYSVPEQRQASPSPPPTPSQLYNRPNRL